MSSLRARGMTSLIRIQKVAGGVSVTYTRKTGQVYNNLTAIPGTTTFRSTDKPGIVEISTRDYVIEVADLFVGGVESPPVLGDQIQEILNGQVYTFEVETPDEGSEDAARYSSPSRVSYRCHCKIV